MHREERSGMNRIVVFNAGSSSLKYAVFEADGRTRVSGSNINAGDPDEILAKLAGQPDGPLSGGIAVFGHRVVHGGPDLTKPVLVDPAMLAQIEALEPLAPLHNPPALALLTRLRARFPDARQVACFDTSFHRGHPAVADRFAIPDEFYRAGVRRYGFHGLSYEYIAGVLPETIAPGRVVVAHLGSGASMCALQGGRSVASTMAFTPLDGLPMGTRAGEIDAGVLLWLIRERGFSPDRLEQFLYRECGLAGISGLSGDMRELLASNAPLARLAVEYFVYHAARAVAGLAGAMGGIDGLVFTGGIGEHSAPVRAAILDRVAWLGFALDAEANRDGPLLTRADSGRPAYVIATDEELAIARHTAALVGMSPLQLPPS